MPELNLKQFETLAKLLRSDSPSKEAARLVLVEGKTVTDAVSATGALPPNVRNRSSIKSPLYKQHLARFFRNRITRKRSGSFYG